jgi:hypothetical protein
VISCWQASESGRTEGPYFSPVSAGQFDFNHVSGIAGAERSLVELVPDFTESEICYFYLDCGVIDGSRSQNCGNIADVFAGPSFTKILHFSENHVFGWSDTQWGCCPRDCSALRQGPEVKGVPGGQINVRFIATVVMDYIKMTSLSSGLFDRDNGGRRQVKFGFGKDLGESRDGGLINRDNHVDIVSYSGLAVDDGRSGTGDHVVTAEFVKLLGKK